VSAGQWVALAGLIVSAVLAVVLARITWRERR
jgi:hypothetical protein